MASTPWGATLDILRGGGLEAIARAHLGSTTGESIRQVVFGRYPALPIGQKNYLVGLTGAFESAGNEQQGALMGLPVPIADIPINMGMGGVATAIDRFRYSTYVGVADPSGAETGSVSVDVYSPVELTQSDITQAAESTLAGWASRYPKLAKYLQEHPTPLGVTVIGIQRAF